jgi:hypothetical protein
MQNCHNRSITSIVSSCILNYVKETKYAKIDHTQSSFLESGMSNRLRPSDDYVRGNLTALS